MDEDRLRRLVRLSPLRAGVAPRAAPVGPEGAIAVLLFGFVPHALGFAQTGINLFNQLAHEVFREPFRHGHRPE